MSVARCYGKKKRVMREISPDRRNWYNSVSIFPFIRCKGLARMASCHIFLFSAFCRPKRQRIILTWLCLWNNFFFDWLFVNCRCLIVKNHSLVDSRLFCFLFSITQLSTEKQLQFSFRGDFDVRFRVEVVEISVWVGSLDSANSSLLDVVDVKAPECPGRHQIVRTLNKWSSRN